MGKLNFTKGVVGKNHPPKSYYLFTFQHMYMGKFNAQKGIIERIQLPIDQVICQMSNGWKLNNSNFDLQNPNFWLGHYGILGREATREKKKMRTNVSFGLQNGRSK